MKVYQRHEYFAQGNVYHLYLLYEEEHSAFCETYETCSWAKLLYKMWNHATLIPNAQRWPRHFEGDFELAGIVL